MKEDKHREIFEHYNSLGLIKHRDLTPEMRSAMDVARRRGGYDWDDLKTLITRHAHVVEITASNEYPVRPRPITEFFGRKVYNGIALICSEYADDGAKWLLYKDGNAVKRSDTPKREPWERPIVPGQYDHLYTDPFADEETP